MLIVLLVVQLKQRKSLRMRGTLSVVCRHLEVNFLFQYLICMRHAVQMLSLCQEPGKSRIPAPLRELTSIDVPLCGGIDTVSLDSKPCAECR